MNKIFAFIISTTTGLLLFSTACKKTIDPPSSDLPDSTANYRYILVKDLATDLPAAGCTVTLYQGFSLPFCSDINWTQLEVLGQTDQDGKLVWKWDGKPLSGNMAVCANDFNNNSLPDLLKLDNMPPEEMQLIKRSGSFIKLHLDYQLDTLPDRKIELVSVSPSVNCYAPQENPVLTLPATHPFDTTLILQRMAGLSYTYKIRYLVDFSTYDTYTHSGKSEVVNISFPVKDTAEVTVVIK